MRKVGIAAMLTVAFLVTGGIWFAAATKGPTKTGYVSAYQPPKAVAQKTALFIGDSFIAGADGVTSNDTFAWQTCAVLSWICNVDGQDGTGYVNDGHEANSKYNSYVDRVAADKIRFKADVIIVSGGRNDRGLAGTKDAATKLFADLHTAYPDAKLVVLQPFWTDDDPADTRSDIETQVQQAASAQDATWISTQDWLSQPLVGEDGMHPTAKGHTQLATRLVAALKTAGAA